MPLDPTTQPNSALVRSHRPARIPVDPLRPYAFLTEPERSRLGVVEDVATIFLVNSECPFTCIYCDLWKHTLTGPTPRGAIPAQIDFAFEQLGITVSADSTAASPRQIKLYNSGNFFDRRAVPPEDWPAIAERVRSFETVIVENHPRLCGEDCLKFRDLIAPAQLEIAMGLETVHPEILPRLNKGMTIEDFSTAARFLRREEIAVRAFLLLRPPGLSEQEGVHWTLRSLEFAFDCGADCGSIIPVRDGNGWMEQLQLAGAFESPRLESMESVLEQGLALGRGRVFVDLWDADRFSRCGACAPTRIARLRAMNLAQRPIPPVSCDRCPG